jgi:hypothetical protein
MHFWPKPHQLLPLPALCETLLPLDPSMLPGPELQLDPALLLRAEPLLKADLLLELLLDVLPAPRDATRFLFRMPALAISHDSPGPGRLNPLYACFHNSYGAQLVLPRAAQVPLPAKWPWLATRPCQGHIYGFWGSTLCRGRAGSPVSFGISSRG